MTRHEFIKFCKKYGKRNLRTSGSEIHYTVPITDDTRAFLEACFMFAKISTIYSFGQPVGIRYQKADCVWEEYAADFDCSYSITSGLKDMLIAFLPKEKGVACEAY